MALMDLHSWSEGRWVGPGEDAREIASAVTGQTIARAGSGDVSFEAMTNYAREVGGTNLRAMTFHQRAAMLKALAQYLNERRDPLYQLSFETGATQRDNLIDIDGGIATLFVYASKGRRELPDKHILPEGNAEILAKGGAVLGQHVLTPLQGIAVHINAFNFPVWGMLEKLAPTLLAGVPAIVKPATASSYVTEACFRMMVDSGFLPNGAVQFVAGSTGNMLDLMTGQDVVSFTGSAETAKMLRTTPSIIESSARFIAEQDSLNASILGPDCGPETPEFDLFVREVVKEMTVKAGQKCTAIRRIIIPQNLVDPVAEALRERLATVRIGHPANEETRMGALVSQEQRRDVLDKVAQLSVHCETVLGNQDGFDVDGADREKGAFVAPVLLHCRQPHNAEIVHSVEAFGPVSTIVPYSDPEDAVSLTNRGQGSLVASVFTNDGSFARDVALGSASFHGRMLFVNRENGRAHSGHGSPLPHLVHGGPGRAGGSEEMGGIRGVKHYMQRTAIQAGPDMLTAITGEWFKGAPVDETPPHPFRLAFDELDIGKTLHTAQREVTLEDIEHFAKFTGDTFYAHMDEEAAAANPFFPGRVAHGYLLLSFAAGLFVDPDPGPVLANYGLDNLRFIKPVSPGDVIRVQLTAKEKTRRNPDYGEVRWAVEITNQDGDPVAQYELLTMNAMSGAN